MFGLIRLHDVIVFPIILSVILFVTYFLCMIRFLFSYRNMLRGALKQRNWEPMGMCIFEHASALEIIWTFIPSILLLIIAVPSFSYLFQSERLGNPYMTIKVIGHKWYWSYESNFGSKGYDFDSIMLQAEDLDRGEFRLLEVDNPLVLPVFRRLRFLVTSADVLHCWAVPCLAIKIDGVPGRLNQLSTILSWQGSFHGQCSEICGVNHGFMPIKIISVIECEW